MIRADFEKTKIRSFDLMVVNSKFCVKKKKKLLRLSQSMCIFQILLKSAVH